MRRQTIISAFLSLILCFGFQSRMAIAGDDRVNRIRVQVADLPLGTEVRVHLKEGRKLQGRLYDRGEDNFEIELPDHAVIAYSDVKSVKPLHSSAANRTLGNSALSRGSKILIISAIGAVVLILAAVELGKS